MAESCETSLRDPYDISELIYFKQTEPKKYLSTNPVLRVLIDGICDEECILFLLNGTPHVLYTIWDYVVQYWKKCIKPTSEAKSVLDQDDVAYAELSGRPIAFPKPRDIYINMMPFIMERTFEDCMLPKYLKAYWDEVINKEFDLFLRPYRYNPCRIIADNEIGKIGYLTIHESYVEKDKTQRRAGLHTDCPGKLMVVPNKENEYICLGRVSKDDEEEVCNDINNKLGNGYCEDKEINYTHPWGMAMTRDGTEIVGGIYMASNVAESCEVWDCLIKSDENGDEIIGDLGDVEYLREFLPADNFKMKSNQMYWITDRTPHESLPLKEGTYRQYFRLVTSEVSLWFEEHSTKNPLGVVPDPTKTKIVKGSKFEDNFALLLDLEPGTKPPGKEDKKKRKEIEKQMSTKKKSTTKEARFAWLR